MKCIWCGHTYIPDPNRTENTPQVCSATCRKAWLRAAREYAMRQGK